MSNKEKLTIHQTSTMIALLDGVFDGVVTYKDLAKKGDFGIGTLTENFIILLMEKPHLLVKMQKHLLPL